VTATKALGPNVIECHVVHSFRVGAAILLVEENADVADALAELLADEGYRVRRVADGVEAAVAAAREKFDVAIVDLEVPHLGGIGVERAIGDLDGVAIVAVSAQSTPWKRAAFDAGASACLAKPFSFESMASVLRAIVRSSRPDGAGLHGDVRELDAEDLARVASMGRDELDALPFGIIRVDPDGVVREFNAYEQEGSTFARDAVLGRRFADIAPCTLVQEFTDAVDRCRDGTERDRVLRFVFPHRDAHVAVTVRIFCDDAGQLWIFVSRGGRAPQGVSLSSPAGTIAK
jgi:photoactive yellow protein